MSQKIIHFCDVCSQEKQVKEKNVQVIFLTEQTEGRNVNPYLSDQKLEICDGCYSHILKGNYLYGHGAMGYNKYHFKDMPNG